MLNDKYLSMMFDKRFFAESFNLISGEVLDGIFDEQTVEDSFGGSSVLGTDSKLTIKLSDLIYFNLKENSVLIQSETNDAFKIKKVIKNVDKTAFLQLERQ